MEHETFDAPDLGPIVSGAYLNAGARELQWLSVAAYRLLATGQPVSLSVLAKTLNIGAAEVERMTASFPPSTIDWNDNRELVGFVGLSLLPTPHRFAAGGQQLYTWCVFDALFLPEIIGSTAQLRTHCPQSGREIRVHIAPDGILSAEPDTTVMSWVRADVGRCRDDLRGAFCDHVCLYASKAIFDAADRGQPEMRCIPLDEAFELTRQRNRQRYPDVFL